MKDFVSWTIKELIETNWKLNKFDHKSVLFESDKTTFPEVYLESYLERYARFNYAVAKILNPSRILELGFGLGISAYAFQTACPAAEYTAIDNGSLAKVDTITVEERFENFKRETSNHHHVLLKNSSWDFYRYPHRYDLIHLDAEHTRDAARHDLEVALDWGTWILIDDLKYSQVFCGVGEALYSAFKFKAQEFYLFDNTYSGSMLIRGKGVQ